VSLVNLWLVVRDDAKQKIVERLRWDEAAQGEYTGPVKDRANNIFRKLIAGERVLEYFTSPDIGGNIYHMFSLYLNGSQQVKSELDWLAVEYPNHIIVGGAWYVSSGRQVGTGPIFDEETGEQIGYDDVPTYPLHPQLYKLMPDVVEYDDQMNEVSRTPATSNADLKDRVLLAGQSPRDFS
jgi:hypothetical protein